MSIEAVSQKKKWTKKKNQTLDFIKKAKAREKVSFNETFLSALQEVKKN